MALAVARVDVGAAVEKEEDDVHMSSQAGPVERHYPLVVFGDDVDRYAALEEHGHHLTVSLQRGIVDEIESQRVERIDRIPVHNGPLHHLIPEL